MLNNLEIWTIIHIFVPNLMINYNLLNYEAIIIPS